MKATHKELRCSECNSQEFVSNLDRYSVYKSVGGKLAFVRSEIAHSETAIYCRECGAEVDSKDAEFL